MKDEEQPSWHCQANDHTPGVRELPHRSDSHTHKHTVEDGGDTFGGRGENRRTNPQRGTVGRTDTVAMESKLKGPVPVRRHVKCIELTTVGARTWPDRNARKGLILGPDDSTLKDDTAKVGEFIGLRAHAGIDFVDWVTAPNEDSRDHQDTSQRAADLVHWPLP
jgi:hypothetical protein